MKYVFDSDKYVLKLQKGERLSEAIEQFVQAVKPQGGWVSGLGATLEVTLGFYDLESRTYQWQTFDDVRECVSLTGNLAFNEQGAIMFHLHGVFADRHYQAVGGHVKDLVVGGTLELFIQPTQQRLVRQTDPEVGLQTLDL